jgi:RHS repeat-associated protein
VSAQIAIAEPRRIKASHRRRRKIAAGHFVQRYYDPQIGRFLSRDPANSTFSLYAYGNNNPYRFVDPDGRENVAGIQIRFPDPLYFTEERTQHPSASDQKAMELGQKVVDLTVEKVMSSGTPEQKESLNNWDPYVDPDLDVARGTKSGAGGTNYTTETITTEFAGKKLAEAIREDQTSNGMTGKKGDAALLMIGCHEFCGHGNQENSELPTVSAREDDARERTWGVVQGTPGISCPKCEEQK